jgi:GxxExxY protein
MQPEFPRIPDDDEELMRSTIGCCIRVHKALGPGLSESAYANACANEFECAGLVYEAERTIPIRYRERLVAHQRVDLLVGRRVVVEVKAVEAIHPIHVAQVIRYLRVTGLRIGLVVNFNVELLRDGLRRVVL